MHAYLFAITLLQAAAQTQAPAELPSAESEPTVEAEQLVGDGIALVGPDWRVESPVPVRGFLGQFVVQSRWGPIEAQGRELLAIRIAELDALEAMDRLTHTEVFADAMARSAIATGEAVGRVVTRPAETIRGVPAGIGRLIRRTASSARKLAVTVGDTARRKLEDSDESEPTGRRFQARNFASELAGVNRARRNLARRIGVDPYTGNPLIQERLEKLAWAAVAGGMSMDLVTGQIGGSAADLISTSRKIDGLVWDLPPDDIRRQLETRLVERGVEPMEAREFLRNRSFTPTLQLAFVDALETLDPMAGEPELMLLAQTIRGEVHARFLIQQLRMLARDIPDDDPVSELLSFEASVGARTRDGDLWIALPVDLLSWNETANLVAAKDGDPPSRLLVAGAISEAARTELENAGWDVEADVGLAD